MLAPSRARRPRNPIVPGNPKDRTGSAGILRRAVADIRRRYAALLADVVAIFERIPIYGTNDAGAPAERTIYGLTAEEMAAVSLALREAVERRLGPGASASSSWWAGYDAEASQAGAAQSVLNLTALSESYAAARDLQAVLFSQPYRNRVAMAQIRSYEHWTGLAAELRSELSQIIGRAVVDGKNPRAVRTEIAERLDISRSRAALYAQTDITGTLREARWAESDHARDEMGIRTGLLHTSAFLPTTRQSHAARHGKVYSTTDVREWYAKDGNRYRCHCGQTECLLDDEDAPILTDSLKGAMAKERQVWQKRHGS